MADIELVIKLDEDIAHGIIDGENDEPKNIVRGFQATIAHAIKNGIPLPKGHGRLIDADALLNNSNIYAIWLNGVYEDCILTDVINNAPTIIEADKEQEDEK